MEKSNPVKEYRVGRYRSKDIGWDCSGNEISLGQEGARAANGYGQTYRPVI